MSDDAYSTVAVSRELGISYRDALDWAATNGLPRVGTAYIWTPQDVAQLEAEIEATDDEDYESDDDEEDDEESEDDYDDDEDD